jgi:glycopeptide antibiotics resistance protein
LIIIPYVYIAIILISIWIIYRAICLKKSKKKNFKREFIINIFFIYFLILINLTICKMSMLQINLDNSFYINYIPLVETFKMFNNNFMGVGNALYNVIGNILLFIPFGFLVPLLFKKKNKFLMITLYGFFTSVLIEIVQLFTSFNTTDIDDIIFNTLGAIIGYIIFNIFYYLIKKTKLGELVRVITS